MIERDQVDGLQVLRGAAPVGTGGELARPPLLLVHGAGHGAWCWEPWLERLPGLGWKAFALSLRHHPGSRELDERTFLERTSVDDYTDDVAAVARHLGEPAVVIGHSMGGIVAQRFVARAGRGELDGVPAPTALVLLASVVPGQLGPQRDKPVPADRPYAPSRERAQAMYFHGDGPLVQQALDRITPESPSVINEYSTGAGVPIDPADVRCPVLVVTAAHDGTTVPHDARIAEYYGGEHLHADIGHDVMLDPGWKALQERILDWVQRRVVLAG